jgi:peptide/nickel transport system substrate-binding protein
MSHDLVVALEGTLGGSLDPHTLNSLYGHAVLWPVCEPLFDVRADGTPTPLLIERWPTPSGLTYTFTLRKKITFHNGDPLDGEAVAKNLARAANLDSSRGRILRRLIKTVEKSHDGQSVNITLNYEKPELLYVALMRTPATFDSKTPSGTGPFELKQWTRAGAELTAYKDYRGGKPTLHSITFQATAGPSAAATQLLQDKVHLARTIDAGDIPLILHSAKHQPRTVNPLGTYYMGLHAGSSALREVPVRQALRDAIDRQTLAYGTGLASALGPIPPGVEGHDPDLDRKIQKTAQPRQMLEHAFRDPVPLLFNRDSWYARIIVPGLERDLAKSGVKADPQGISGSDALVGEIKRRGQLGEAFFFVYNWYSILPAAEIFLGPLFDTGMPDNLTGYSGVHHALEAARQPGLSPADRVKRYQDAQKKIVEDAPAVFLAHPQVRVSAQSARVSGLDPANLNAQSFPVDRFLGVDVP